VGGWREAKESGGSDAAGPADLPRGERPRVGPSTAEEQCAGSAPDVAKGISGGRPGASAGTTAGLRGKQNVAEAVPAAVKYGDGV
jgi:hypothetical protein